MKKLHEILKTKYPDTECVVVKEVADSTSRNRYLDYYDWFSQINMQFVSVQIFDHNEELLQEKLFDLTNPKIQGKILWHSNN